MKYLRWIITAIVLWVIAAVSVRVAPTPGGWWHLWWVAVLVLLLYLWWTRPKRKL